MEYLFLAAILYFVLRTAGNLVRLLSGDGGFEEVGGHAENGTPQHGWEGPSPREETGLARDEPTFWGDDIEDATWEDLDQGSHRTR